VNWAGNECDAPLLLTPERDAFVKQPIFYALAHFARFLPPGSRRLAQPAASGATARVDVVAYLTPTRRLAAVLLNKDAAERCVRLRDLRRRARDAVPAAQVAAHRALARRRRGAG
jgi:glucosylceramidase